MIKRRTKVDLLKDRLKQMETDGHKDSEHYNALAEKIEMLDKEVLK